VLTVLTLDEYIVLGPDIPLNPQSESRKVVNNYSSQVTVTDFSVTETQPKITVSANLLTKESYVVVW
jgi:hypothetical protein